MSIAQIQKRAVSNKGSYVHYSQSEEPTSTLISMLPYTEDGICQALSAKWIAEHANGGSLWNWLFKPGSKTPDPGKIANLMINFTESIVRTGGDIDHSQGNRKVRSGIASRLSNKTTRSKNTGGQYYQDFVTEKYLGLYGVARRNIVQACYTGSMGKRIKHGLGPKTAQVLGATLQQKYMNTKGGAYVLISVLGDGGHAMAAYVGQDIAFFDPNFGEFWFPSHLDFYRFFLDFWKLSGYISDFDSFYLLPYAKKA